MAACQAWTQRHPARTPSGEGKAGMLTARRRLAPSVLVLVVLGLLVGWGGIMRAVGSPSADQAAARPSDAPSASGKVLVANETSGTVSVTDVATNRVVDRIC